MFKYGSVVTSIIVSLSLMGGCEQNEVQTTQPAPGGSPVQVPDAPKPNETAAANIKPSQAATTQPANNNVSGVVAFTQAGDDALVVAEITGLSPGKHGFHIHEKGDMSDPQLKSVGDHYNPGGHKHGGAEGDTRHAGDLGNLEADASGKASYSQTIKGLKISDISGRSVIVHATEDDLKTDPSGNSGGRIAGGVIEKQ